MSEEYTDNPIQEPVIDEVEPSDVVEEELDESQESELDENGDPVEQEDDSEEVDYEGEKYKLPKKLKDALLRQSDYTKKTQEVAEQRRQLETERVAREQLFTAKQETIGYQVQLQQIGTQLQQLDQINWDELSKYDPAEANRLWIHRSQLAESYGTVAQQVGQAEKHALSVQQELIAKKAQEGHAVLSRDIPDWSPAKQKQLAAFAVNDLGIPAEVLDTIYDPSIVKLINEVYTNRKSTGKPAVAKQTTPQLKPNTVIRSKSAGPKDDMRLSAEEWAAKRNAEIAKRNRR